MSTSVLGARPVCGGLVEVWVVNTVDVTWILVSAALVLFMVPGLALFYGGMSRSKNMLNMLMMNMV